MDNPGDAKYGMTREQLTQAFRRLKELGAEEFGIHAFLAPTPCPTTITPPWPGFCSGWLWS